MGVSTRSTGGVTLATVATVPKIREACLTRVSMHQNTTTNGVKLKQSIQETSRVTNLLKSGELFVLLKFSTQHVFIKYSL